MLGLVKQAAVGICGDAARGRGRAPDPAGDRQPRDRGARQHASARLAEIKRAEGRVGGRARTDWGQADGSPIAPRRALRELEKAMPADAMVTTDIGNICSVANSYLRFERAPSFFAAMSFGNCGYAYPDRDRRQGRGARPPGHRLCRRRRLGHEPAGDADLRAREHPGGGGGVQQRPVGGREEEPDRLLCRPLSRHQPRRTRASPASPRPWAREGIKVDAPGPGRRCAAATPSPAAGRPCSS